MRYKRDDKIALRKSTVITYLKMAQKQLPPAQRTLTENSRLWLRLGKLLSDIEETINELNKGEYDLPLGF